MTNAFDQWRVVVVPFPFADGPKVKNRPAVVLSSRAFNESGNTVMAMITSARHSLWPGDVALDHEAAGLPKPCVVRPKVFTIDNRLIRAALGALAPNDIDRVAHELRMYFPCPQAAGRRAMTPSPS